MLSPFAIHRLLKHFDAIDRAVSVLMSYPRSKDEEQLTGHLVDCFDPILTKHTGLEYTSAQLAADLKNAQEPLSVKYGIQVHKYSKTYENRVSQADLGIILRYEDNYNPVNSSSKSWLLQAKRLYPTSIDPMTYDLRAKFGAVDAHQEERIHQLVHSIDTDFFRYILYCPRPDENMSAETSQALSYLRNEAISDEIFDFAYGLELRDDLKTGSSTVAAGVFVAKTSPSPSTLADVHEKIFDTSTPLSWFLIKNLPHGGYGDADIGRQFHNEIVEKIVKGDESVARDIAIHLNDNQWNGKMLPAATLTITISVGPPNAMDLLPRTRS